MEISTIPDKLLLIEKTKQKTIYLLGLSYIQGIIYAKNQVKNIFTHVFYVQSIIDF